MENENVTIEETEIGNDAFSLLDIMENGEEISLESPAPSPVSIDLPEFIKDKVVNQGGESVKATQSQNGSQPTATKPVEKKQETTESGTVTSQTTAKGFVFMFDLLMSRGCSMLAKEKDFEQFKLQPEEKRELTEAAKNYFETVDFQMSPGMVLLMTAAIIATGNVSVAYEMKREKEKMNREARNFTREEPVEKSTVQTAINEKKEAAKIVKAVNREVIQPEQRTGFDYGNRKRFEVDKNGLYVYSAPSRGKSVYLKVSERSEAATQEVVSWKNQGLSNSQILKKIKSYQQ